MKVWKAILAALVIFCAGAVTGALTTRLVQGRAAPQSVRPERLMDFGLNRRRDFIARLDRDLHLTTEQHQRIEKILGESQDRIRKLWQTIDPKAQEEVKHTHELIREVLTPEQQKKFEELSKFHGRRKPGEPPGQPPSRDRYRWQREAPAGSAAQGPAPEGITPGSTNGK